MASYDQLKETLQELYDAAQKELVELEKRRQEILKDIQTLGSLCGKKTYSIETLKATSSTASVVAAPAVENDAADDEDDAKEEAGTAKKRKGGRRVRIKGEDIHEFVLKLLNDNAPNSMTPIEIFAELVKAGMPDITTFRTRVYNLLSSWVEAGEITKVSRGVYRAKLS